jgi:membrane associated rhomboid family serine protease
LGIHDRDYARSPAPAEGGDGARARGPLGTTVAWILLAAAAVWALQIGTKDAATDALAASWEALRAGRVWTLLTSVFAHSTAGLGHLFWNMVFLLVFAPEVERIYGRGRFLVLYLGAGTLAAFAEVLLQHLRGHDGIRVVGASGAVMAAIVVHTLVHPHRVFLLLFLIPVRLWVLCLLFIAGDVSGFLHGGAGGVANLAHLTGAAVGLAWKRLARGAALGRPRPAVRPRPAAPPREGPPPVPPEVARRIDAILDRIAEQGIASLPAEDRAFLEEHAARYRGR